MGLLRQKKPLNDLLEHKNLEYGRITLRFIYSTGATFIRKS
jgi:hypothetical protein